MSRLNEYFGFIQKEVDQILRDAGAASIMLEQCRKRGMMGIILGNAMFIAHGM